MSISAILRNSIAIGFLLSGISPGLARAGPDSTASGVTVRIRRFNYAKVPRWTLQRAEKYATKIMRRTGVELDWVECLAPAAGEVSPICYRSLRPIDLVLRILPRSMAKRLDLPAATSGLALPSKPGEFAVRANVFFHRAKEVARLGGFPFDHHIAESMVLGHLMAHEIGHLLLGPRSHSPNGLMRCPWGRKELRECANGKLEFTQQQIQKIRANVYARMRAEQEQRLD